MESFNEKRKPTINLSLFSNLGVDSFSSPNPNRSPRNFQNGGVGLGIVAAMTDLSNTHEPIFSVVKSPRSRPIPIVSSSVKTPPVVVNFRDGGGGVNLEMVKESTEEEVDELSESYTCVISHIANDVVKKRVYFDDGGKLENYSVFFASSSPMNIGCEVKKEFCGGDFLSSCFLCKKQLHGLDIFMYRGEKAFCSADCRDKQIRSDDRKEKCGSEARKSPLDYSVSPCSGQQVLFAGVAVA